MGAKETVKVLLHPFHIFNILFSMSYMCAKLIEPLCHLMFPDGTEAELNSVSISPIGVNVCNNLIIFHIVHEITV